MSGFVGLCYLDGRPAEVVTIERMTESLEHRGPDGAGTFCRGSVALGHRKLSVTPESLYENLPLVSDDDQIVVTADARIDNREELLAYLPLRRPLSTVTDSDLILAAYQRWGTRCTEYLIGDFAFVIWDAAKQHLFCARDHFGMKPFYYYHAPGRLFVCASEIKALFCLSDVPCCLNDVQVGRYLTQSFDNKESTFYQDIVRLPGAHQIIVNSQTLRCIRYWEPDREKEIRFRQQEEYVEAFREHLTTAVRCRIRSAYPVSSTLSGGLDSSTVASIAARLLQEATGRRLHTFSAIFPRMAALSPAIDERVYIDAVLQSGRYESHKIVADQLDPLLPAYWMDDEVVPGLNFYMDYQFYREAHQHGIRVLLTGHDGDTVVSHGYERLEHIFRTIRWLPLFYEIEAFARHAQASRRKLLWHHAVVPTARRFLSFFPPSTFQRNRRDGAKNERMGILQNEFAHLFQYEYRQELAAQPKPGKSLRAAHWGVVESGLYSYAVELVEQLAAPFHIEVRHPFFDKRLVEYCLALPIKQKFQQGWPRAILRFATEGVLPDKVRWRLDKGRLGTNFDLRLLECHKDLIEDILYRDKNPIEDFVNMDYLRQMYQMYQQKPLEHSEAAITISMVVILAHWLHEHQVLRKP